MAKAKSPTETPPAMPTEFDQRLIAHIMHREGLNEVEAATHLTGLREAIDEYAELRDLVRGGAMIPKQ